MSSPWWCICAQQLAEGASVVARHPHNGVAPPDLGRDHPSDPDPDQGSDPELGRKADLDPDLGRKHDLNPDLEPAHQRQRVRPSPAI